MQLSLPLLCRIDAPSIVAPDAVKACQTYREAVRLCWDARKVRGATQRSVAEHVGCQPSHMSEYLSDDADKRDMPAKLIKAFEAYCGNCAVSQWIALGARFTVLEEMQARAA